MPSLSPILLGDSKPLNPPPCYTFHGPDAEGHIRALNSSQIEVARFILQKRFITRLQPTHQHICSFKTSSLSGTTTLDFHGQQIKMKQSWEGMRYGKDIHTQSIGMLKWRAGSGGYEELHDAGKRVIARGKFPGSISRKEYPLEVFVAGDEFLLDLVIISWVVTLKGQEKEDEEMEAVGEVIGALAGS